ncbi:hypothetical protein M514_03657 [Trichuris suis]|uniref:Uncharacterized protein n=1 Tax=Trichuris suis TaxID=68888 RepID=A0A085MR59_9BILA|nr:hypothetical protein M514_03657 [Trichuris suis]
MNSFICFIAAAVLAVQASENTCDKTKADEMVELTKSVFRQQPLIEPTATVHNTSHDPQNKRFTIAQMLNLAMGNLEFSYKFKKAKAAVTCSIGRENTTVVILQLQEANCKRSKGHSTTTFRRSAVINAVDVLTPIEQKCRFKEAKTIDCVWSGGSSSLLPFTYGFWCVETKGDVIDYPNPKDICSEWRYKETTAYRLPVPEKYRPWEVDMLAYQPPHCSFHPRFGAQCTKFSVDELKDLKGSSSPELRHKDGRTGIRGPGFYRRLGKNDFMQYLILRKSESGDKQVLVERAAVKAGYLLLPESPPGTMPFLNVLGDEVKKEEMNSKCCSCSRQLPPELLQKAQELYGGDMWDGRNTDDAWLNFHSYVITDEKLLAKIKYGADSAFTWLSINETTAKYLKGIVESTFPSEMAKQLTKPTGSLTEKLGLLKRLDVVKTTIRITNCVASFYPLVPMGLPVKEFLGILSLAVFYF